MAAAPAPLPGGDLAWPTAYADSPQAAASELADDFDMLGDWDARDQFVVEMGEKLPPMPDTLKRPECLVHGCMSTVHMIGRKRPGSADRLDILADSDAHLVRGLIGLLQHLFAGQKASDILAFDTPGFLRKIGLEGHLSMGRRSGLEGMINRIRIMARELQTTGHVPSDFAVAQVPA
jgi:cysteine desulfurase/selenocysteine lyase